MRIKPEFLQFIYVTTPQQNKDVTVIVELRVAAADAIEFCPSLFCEVHSLQTF